MIAVTKERNLPCKHWPFQPWQTVRSTWYVSTPPQSLAHLLSPAPGVGSHASVVCLWTGVSSGNRPMFNTKSRKCRVPLEGPAGTEYLEDAALEQRGKVRGSRRSPGQ